MPNVLSSLATRLISTFKPQDGPDAPQWVAAKEARTVTDPHAVLAARGEANASVICVLTDRNYADGHYASRTMLHLADSAIDGCDNADEQCRLIEDLADRLTTFGGHVIVMLGSLWESDKSKALVLTQSLNTAVQYQPITELLQAAPSFELASGKEIRVQPDGTMTIRDGAGPLQAESLERVSQLCDLSRDTTHF